MRKLKFRWIVIAFAELASASTCAFAQAPVVQREPTPDPAPTRAQSIETAYDESVNQARVLLRIHDANGALASSQKAIALDDRRWEAYVAAAQAYSSQGSFDDAVGMLQSALVRAPEDRKQLIRDALATTRRSASTTPQPSVGTMPPPPVVAPAQPTQAEIVLWKTIEKSTSSADFVAYLDAYPNGVYAPLAKARIAALAEAVRNLSSVGRVTEIQHALQYLIFEIAPGSNVAVGDTVVIRLRDQEVLEMTVQRRVGSAASATTRGRLDGINVGAGVFKRPGGA